MDPTTGTIVPMWLGSTDADGAALESQSVDLGEPMPECCVVWLEFLMTGPANRLYGAVLVYREAE
jgi:hypothetical protein